jgi:hypothetical protein
MKKTVIIIAIQFLIFSCGLFGTKPNGYSSLPENFNLEEEIGKKFSSVNLNFDSLSGEKGINGVHHGSTAFCLGDKILVYVTDIEGYVVDCYFTNFIDYRKIKRRIALGTSHADIKKKLGEPVFILEYPDGKYPSFSYHYLQRSRGRKDDRQKYVFYPVGVVFYFGMDDYKLSSFREYGLTRIWGP